MPSQNAWSLPVSEHNLVHNPQMHPLVQDHTLKKNDNQLYELCSVVHYQEQPRGNPFDAGNISSLKHQIGLYKHELGITTISVDPSNQATSSLFTRLWREPSKIKFGPSGFYLVLDSLVVETLVVHQTLSGKHFDTLLGLQGRRHRNPATTNMLNIHMSKGTEGLVDQLGVPCTPCFRLPNLKNLSQEFHSETYVLPWAFETLQADAMRFLPKGVAVCLWFSWSILNNA